MSITLAGIRSELRALMALDERGEIDQPQRHKVLFQIVADLQDFEVNQDEAMFNILRNTILDERQ